MSNTLSPYIREFKVKVLTAALPNLLSSLKTHNDRNDDPMSKGAIPTIALNRMDEEFRIVFVIMLYPLEFSKYFIRVHQEIKDENPSIISAWFTVAVVLIDKNIEPTTHKISPAIIITRMKLELPKRVVFSKKVSRSRSILSSSSSSSKLSSVPKLSFLIDS